MSLYKVGDTVYMGDRKLVIAEVLDEPMIPVYRYGFEPPHERMVCAANSLSSFPNGLTHSLSDDRKEDYEDGVQVRVNTAAATFSQEIEDDFLGVGVFFKPDFTFVKWLSNYAGDRLIIDVGSGQGHLVNMLDRVGAKVMGIEPDFDYVHYMNGAMLKGNFNPNKFLPWDIQRAKKLVQDLGDKVLLVFARPCHSDFVEVGIDNLLPGQEALYITIPESLELYNDLGKYEGQAVLVEHEGTSEDEEVVYSVIKK